MAGLSSYDSVGRATCRADEHRRMPGAESPGHGFEGRPGAENARRNDTPGGHPPGVTVDRGRDRRDRRGRGVFPGAITADLPRLGQPKAVARKCVELVASFVFPPAENTPRENLPPKGLPARWRG